MIDKDDLAYVAGYLDGEGCFTVRNERQAMVVCENTHRPTIEWLHQMFGGSMSANVRKKKPTWRPTYRWSVVSRQAAEVCRLVAPYLREKMEQALLLIAIQQLSGNQGARSPTEQMQERTRLAVMVKGLKHVSS